jgi:transposase
MAKSKTSKRYTREFRRELVALHRAGRSIPELSREFGPTPWTIALWVRQDDRDGGRGDGGLTTSEREELARLRRDNKRLKLEREILAKAAAWFAQETAPNSKNSSNS